MQILNTEHTKKKYWLTFSPSDGMKAACVRGPVCYNEVRNRIKPLQGVIVTVQGSLLILYCHPQLARTLTVTERAFTELQEIRTQRPCVQSRKFKNGECNATARSN
jgi:hypothetical protein